MSCYVSTFVSTFGAQPASMTNDDTLRSRPDEPASRLVLSVPEAADLLGISRALGYELVARGELPSLRLGRRIVVPRAALLSLVASA